MSETVLRKAFFELQSGPQSGEHIDVHFNPVSLQYELSNNLQDEGSGSQKKQYVSKSTAKLSMELVFDTTDTRTDEAEYTDVREHTGKVARLMQPVEGEKTLPPVVSFEWGVYKFQGMVESYKETIDFFSDNGIPLRSTVSLTMASQEQVFETQTATPEDERASSLPDTAELPRGESGSASQLANQAGDPGGARQIAQQNGDESLRFPGQGNAVVSEGPNLQGPVAFASGGGGFGASIGGGFGASAGGGFGASAGGGFGASAGGGFGASAGGGFGASAGGGFGASAGGGFGASAGGGFGASAGASFTDGGSVQAGASNGTAFGARASAGVPATAGAFAGLRAPAAQRTGRPRLRVSRLVERGASTASAPGPGSTFRPGGRLAHQGAGSFTASAGASASLNDLIQFEEDET
jgi:hypothetical protein